MEGKIYVLLLLLAWVVSGVMWLFRMWPFSQFLVTPGHGSSAVSWMWFILGGFIVPLAIIAGGVWAFWNVLKN